MKKLLLFSLTSTILLGCNMKPSKEARIQTLEAEIVQTKEKTDGLESRIQTLEEANKQLESRILELEKQ